MTRVCAFLLVAASLAYAADPIKVGITEYQNTGQAYVKYRHFLVVS
jgi:hypothetical protein